MNAHEHWLLWWCVAIALLAALLLLPRCEAFETGNPAADAWWQCHEKRLPLPERDRCVDETVRPLLEHGQQAEERSDLLRMWRQGVEHGVT